MLVLFVILAVIILTPGLVFELVLTVILYISTAFRTSSNATTISNINTNSCCYG